MPSLLRSIAAFAVVSAMVVLSVPGCSQQGEGQRCDRNSNGDADCDSGLVCIASGSLRDSPVDRCCKADGSSSDSRCDPNTGKPSNTGGSSGTAGSGGSSGSSAAGGGDEGGTSAGTDAGGTSSSEAGNGSSGAPTQPTDGGAAGATPVASAGAGAGGAP